MADQDRECGSCKNVVCFKCEEKVQKCPTCNQQKPFASKLNKVREAQLKKHRFTCRQQCRKVFAYDDLIWHEKLGCQKAYQCPIGCHKPLGNTMKEIAEHFDECLKVKIQCKSCQNDFSRKNSAKHQCGEPIQKTLEKKNKKLVEQKKEILEL